MTKFIIGFFMVLALAGIGVSTERGLNKIADSIKMSAGFVNKCEGPWFDQKCEWVKS